MIRSDYRPAIAAFARSDLHRADRLAEGQRRRASL